MKKLLCCFLCLCFLCMPNAIAQADNSRTGYTEKQLAKFPSIIFAQTDSYMAVELGSRHPISFFLIHKIENAFDGKIIERVWLDMNENIEFSNARLMSAEACGRFYAKSLLADLVFHQEGHYEFRSISILFTDGSQASFPIGRIVMDVFAEEGADALYTYATTAMSSNSEELFCRYVKYKDDAAYTGLYVDLVASYEVVSVEEEAYHAGGKDMKDAYGITVQFASEYPAVYRYVLPRVFVQENGVERVVYPKFGCYCGGLGITEGEVLNAYEKWNMAEGA